MYADTKKIHLIEEILKIENDEILIEVEAVIERNRTQTLKRKSFKNFAGMMSDDEVNEFEKAIEDGCEKINPDDWK